MELNDACNNLAQLSQYAESKLWSQKLMPEFDFPKPKNSYWLNNIPTGTIQFMGIFMDKQLTAVKIEIRNQMNKRWFSKSRILIYFNNRKQTNQLLNQVVFTLQWITHDESWMNEQRDQESVKNIVSYRRCLSGCLHKHLRQSRVFYTTTMHSNIVFPG